MFVRDSGATWAPTLAVMTVIHVKVDDRARQNLRLDVEIWAAIDAARMRRAGTISRNTWITEAIAEKLALEQNNSPPHWKSGSSHV